MILPFTLQRMVAGRLIYVAGPYRADTEAERLLNVRRACRVASAVMQAGGIPIVVHPAIYHEVYGPSDDADEQQRERGVANTLALALYVRNAGGACVTILREDGSLSQGTKDEAALFEAHNVYPLFPFEISLSAQGQAL
jgi:hypothetical protein